MLLENFKLAILNEIKLPDFKGRHLFIARLRLLIFLLSWGLCLLFFPQIWSTMPAFPLVFNCGFLLTAICYWNIVQEKHVVPMTLLEVVADVISQTAFIYILGADSVAVFFLYGLYVAAAGTFFGDILALIASIAALVSYGLLLFLLQIGVFPPFDYTFQYSVVSNIQNFGLIFNLLFLPIALGVIIYGTRIGQSFSKMKERALETRNTQLTALHQIGSTIRSNLELEAVIQNVLTGVIHGLGFEACFLALLSRQEDRVLFYEPKGSPYNVLMEEMLGQSLSKMYLPMQARNHSAYQAILKNRVLIRKKLSELLAGMLPEVSEEAAEKFQKRAGFQKFIITPLFAEGKVVGAFIGASKKEFIETSTVDSLDQFANQAALAIETAQLVSQLKKKNVELEEANKIKSDFLAIMSHELRTPLTAIIGFSEILLDRVLGELNKEQRDSLGEVLRNAENLLELINNILDLAKVEAGKMELNVEKFSLFESVSEIQQSLMPLYTKKHQALQIQVPTDLPEILADARKVRQILLNLVGNAIKFTPEGGKITIQATYFSDGKKLISEFPIKSLEDGKSYFRISVIDTGIGIQKEHLSHLFDIFQQVDSTFTRKYQGTGLGLALCRQLVELHGGLIGVTSQFGKGSEFKFILPVSATE